MNHIAIRNRPSPKTRRFKEPVIPNALKAVIISEVPKEDVTQEGESTLILEDRERFLWLLGPGNNESAALALYETNLYPSRSPLPFSSEDYLLFEFEKKKFDIEEIHKISSTQARLSTQSRLQASNLV